MVPPSVDGSLTELFITSVEKDGVLLKVWGQADNQTACSIERQILSYYDQFEKGVGIPDPKSLQIGQNCCARYPDGSYYRARILAMDLLQGLVQVLYYDYGNTDVVPFSNLRVPENSQSLFRPPPQAAWFILAGVAGSWDQTVLKFILDTIGFEEVKCKIASNFGPRGDVQLLTVYHQGRNFIDTLISLSVATPIPENQFGMVVNSGSQSLNSHIDQQPMNINSYSQYPQAQMMNMMNQQAVVNPLWQRLMPTHIGAPGMPAMTMPSPVNVPIPVRPSMSSQALSIRKPLSHSAASQFTSIMLEPGTEHQVSVSHVENGLTSFAVQLLHNEAELEQLMDELQRTALLPLKAPLLPGTMCLARYSVDNSLCRAVVSGVPAEKCNIYYVDYGNSDSLPCQDIYELPPKFTHSKVMALQFSLAGLENISVSDEMKQVFKDIVLSKTVILRVVPPERNQSLAKQYCELFINNSNVKELINNEMLRRHSNVSFRNTLIPETGANVKVVVAYVRNTANFYVQLASKQSSLTAVMACVQEFCCNKAEQLPTSDIQVGTICCALFAGDAQFYRAVIMKPDAKAPTVLFVDYGNEEVVPVSDLRKIDPALVIKLRAQAIPCKLSGLDSKGDDEELAQRFEELCLEETFSMHVVELHREVPCIEVKLSSERGDVATLLMAPAKSVQGETCSEVESRDQNIEVKSDWRNENIKTGCGGPSHGAREICSSSKNGDREDLKGGVNNNDLTHTTSRDGFRTGKNGYQDSAKGGRYGEQDTFRHKSDDRGNFRSARNGPSEEGRFQERPGFDGHRSGFGDKRENFTSRGSKEVSGSARDSYRSSDQQHSVNTSAAEEWNDSPSTTSNVDPPLHLEFLSPSLGSTKPVFMVYSKNLSEFYLQERPTDPGLTSLMDHLSEFYTEGGENLQSSEVTVGALCVARYSEDEMWYRAIIKEVNGSTVNVFFPDYGNQETVDVGNLKRLKTELCTLKCQAIQCSMMGVPSNARSDEQVSELHALADLETLEAEFVHKSDGVYLVVLKDTANGHVINEKFGASAESLLSPTSIVLAVPHATVQVGSSFEAIVSHFINPHKFFITLNSSLKEFKSLMNKLQKGYSNKVALSSASIGQTVVARFTDNALYRAQIKMQRGNKSGVVYLDYGNKSLVDNSSIYGLEQQFATLPCQAIMCCLKDVKPVEDSWPKSCPEMSKMFSGEFTCTIHSQLDPQVGGDETLYCVSLVRAGVDIAQELVDKGLASRELPVTSEIPVAESSVTQSSVTPDEPIALSLLVGQYVPCRVSAVNGNVFYAQLDLQGVQGLTETLQDISQNISALTPLLPSNVVKKQNCLIQSPNSQEMKRAVIVDSATTAGILVHLMDFGDTEEAAPSQLYTMPAELEAIPPQAISCVISTACNSSPRESDINTILKQDVILNVKDVKDGRLEVGVVDAVGHPLPFMPEEKSLTICPMPILRRSMPVFVSHASGNAVWLQQAEQADCIAHMLGDLFAMYEEGGEPLEIVSTGLVCAAKSEDANWYRCIIEELKDDGGVVRYVDYGNTELVPKSSIKKIDSRFLHVPALAVKAVLPVEAADASLEDTILSITGSTEYSSLFVRYNEEWFVELMKGNSELSKELILTGKALSLKNNPVSDLIAKQDSYESMDFSLKSEDAVIVTSVESVTEFYVQTDSSSAAVAQVQEDLQTVALCMKDYNEFPESGTKCMALYDEDRQWYRGEVLPSGQIRFIDYGNVAKVDLSSLKHLPLNMIQLDKLAVPCSLAAPAGKEWTERATFRLQELTIDSEDVIQVKILSETYNKKDVDLVLSGGSIIDTLVSEGHVVPRTSPIPTQAKDVKVFVSFLSSPSDFFVAENGNTVVDTFSSTLHEGNDLLNPTVGMVCAALFVDDGNWYRAQVEAVEGQRFEVLFIDYGNRATTECLKILSEDVLAVPPTVKHCSLNLPANVKKWSEAANARFAELAADGATVFDMTVVSEGSPSIVCLTHDGKKVDEDLLGLCIYETPKSVEPETIEAEAPVHCVVETVQHAPTGGDVDKKQVFISFHSSPSDFFVAENGNTVVDTFSSTLHEGNDLLNPTVGMVCAALFVDDGNWYRAQVEAVEGQRFEVLFIDYGNRASTDRLKILSEDVLAIPPTVKHCTLNLPANVKDWSEAANARFAELAADGATVFDMTVVSEGSPSIVCLTLDGKKVDEDLLGLCIYETPKSTTQEEASQRTASIAYANSPSDFYITFSSDSDNLQNMAECLEDAANFAACEDFALGSLCAALFADDGLWYRAQLLEKSADGYKLLFIDYGNDGVSAEIRSLPEMLQKIPPLAKHCSLPRIEGFESITDEAVERFLHFSEDESVFEVQTCSCEKSSLVVDLKLAGRSILYELAELSGIDVGKVDQFFSLDSEKNKGVEGAIMGQEVVTSIPDTLAEVQEESHAPHLLSECNLHPADSSDHVSVQDNAADSGNSTGLLQSYVQVADQEKGLPLTSGGEPTDTESYISEAQGYNSKDEITPYNSNPDVEEKTQQTAVFPSSSELPVPEKCDVEQMTENQEDPISQCNLCPPDCGDDISARDSSADSENSTPLPQSSVLAGVNLTELESALQATEFTPSKEQSGLEICDIEQVSEDQDQISQCPADSPRDISADSESSSDLPQSKVEVGVDLTNLGKNAPPTIGLAHSKDCENESVPQLFSAQDTGSTCGSCDSEQIFLLLNPREATSRESMWPAGQEARLARHPSTDSDDIIDHSSLVESVSEISNETDAIEKDVAVEPEEISNLILNYQRLSISTTDTEETGKGSENVEEVSSYSAGCASDQLSALSEEVIVTDFEEDNEESVIIIDPDSSKSVEVIDLTESMIETEPLTALDCHITMESMTQNETDFSLQVKDGSAPYALPSILPAGFLEMHPSLDESSVSSGEESTNTETETSNAENVVGSSAALAQHVCIAKNLPVYDSNENVIVSVKEFPSCKSMQLNSDGKLAGLAVAPIGDFQSENCLQAGLTTFIFNECIHSTQCEVETFEENLVSMEDCSIRASQMLAEADKILQSLKRRIESDRPLLSKTIPEEATNGNDVV